MEKTWKGMATVVSWLPSIETSRPTNRRRNSRLSRSGARSTVMRGATAQG